MNAPASLRPEPAGALAPRLLAPRGSVLLYGTTPPRAGTEPALVDKAARTLDARLARLPLDGLLVYDLQEESSRAPAPRPFPFSPVMESSRYAGLLQQLSGRETVVYKCIGTMDEDAWRSWLREADGRHGVRLLTPVGRPSARGGPFPLAITDALRIAVQEAAMVAGGVAIAERHARTGREAVRMAQKVEAGCSFFVSQTIYHPAATLALLADYAAACRRRGLAPARVVLSFAPCGRERTLSFLKWLGVAVPRPVEAAILGAASPLARSIEICRAALRAILEAHDGCVPLGVSVESVSTARDELDASIDLAHALHEELTRYRAAATRAAGDLAWPEVLPAHP